MRKPPATRPGPAINHRAHPELYRVGRGEEGVFGIQPYTSELLPLWRFKTPAIARESAEKLWRMFCAYRTDGDFVGMDMARKYLQMGWTRARRYANHPSGVRYGPDGAELSREEDPEKAEAARIFYERYMRAKSDPTYVVRKAEHRRLYG